jgi:hypothetical protein
MVRMAFSDFTVIEELLKVLLMDISMPLNRLSVITTDGMPIMMGSTCVFIAH